MTNQLNAVTMKSSGITRAYEYARDRYAEYRVDTDTVLDMMQQLSLSLHCWQADDVSGNEKKVNSLSGGIQVTGNYPGKARTLLELRSDLERVYSLIPGRHRLNIHASYGDFGEHIPDRNEILPEHFESWIEWSNSHDIKLDFNSTCFAHSKSSRGFTLSSIDSGIREFWKEHVKRAREISAVIGKSTGSRCIHNLWIPDGSKDLTINRLKHRELLRDSLDEIFKVDYPVASMQDSLESKLFGIGSEAYVVGSHEFYMAYALTRNKMLCLDMGHFHPTESVGDKVSSLFTFVDELMFHFSRGLRWDSDHVVILNDELELVTLEIVRARALSKVNIALDFFDASINRLGAYILGTRAAQVSFLRSMLEPAGLIRNYEESGRGFEKLAMMEETKILPFGEVWNYFCFMNNVPVGLDLINEVAQYERKVLSRRG